MSVDCDSDPDPPTTAYPDCPVVDAHVHVMPDDLFDAVYGWFRAESDWTVPELDAATVVSRARERTDGFVFFPYAHRPGVAEGLNETAADWRNRLAAADVETAALGTVHAGDDDPRTVVRDAFDRGLEGIKLHCPVQGYAPDDERLSPVYEELVARDAPLVVHASTYPFDRGNDDVHPRRLRSVLERFPDLRVCVPHLGLFETPAFLDLADEYDVHFDTAVALGDPAHALAGVRDGELPDERLREYTDRVMFGSDYPIRPLAYADALDSAAATFADPADRRAVFAENAREFYGL